MKKGSGIYQRQDVLSEGGEDQEETLAIKWRKSIPQKGEKENEELSPKQMEQKATRSTLENFGVYSLNLLFNRNNQLKVFCFHRYPNFRILIKH